MNAHIADQRSARPALDRQLEGIGRALFLIMIGGIGLIPASALIGGNQLANPEALIEIQAIAVIE